MYHDRPICFKDDLNEVVDLFRKSVITELQNDSSAQINVDRVVQDFENILTESFQIVPRIQTDSNNQEINRKVEAMQTKALKIKTDLHNHHTAFLENVQIQIERELESKRPQIEHYEEEEEDINEVNSELQPLLNLLDSNINEIKNKANEAMTAMTDDIKKYKDFEKNVSVAFENS